LNLSKKLGPLPVWAWGIIGVVTVYVLYRYAAGTFGSSGAAQETQQVRNVSSPGQAVGLNPQAGSPQDTGQTTQDLMTALGAQQSVLFDALHTARADALAAVTQADNAAAVRLEDQQAFDTQARQDQYAAAAAERADNLTALSMSSSGLQDVTGPINESLGQIITLLTQTATAPANQNTEPQLSTEPNSNTPIVVYVTPDLANTPGEPPVSQTATSSSAAAAHPDKQPFGGVTNVRTLPNGSTVTTYANGRQVQQAPGKSPYVIRRGG